MEPDTILASAKVLERGLDGDAASQREMLPGEAAVNAAREQMEYEAAAGAALPFPHAPAPAREGCGPNELIIRDDSHFNFCVASAIRTGKTTLVVAIAKAMADAGRISQVLIFTAGNEDDTLNAFVSVTRADVRVFAYSAEQVMTWVGNRAEKKDAGDILRPTLVIFDDVVGEGVERDKAVLTLFTRGRHLNVYTAISSQQANNALSPTFKANSRYIIFSQLTGSAMNLLHKDLVLRPEMSPADFRSWVTRKCENFVFGLYDAHGKSLSTIRCGGGGSGGM